MKKIIFNLCDKYITPQPVFRAEPHPLPCACCGSTSRKLGVGKVPGGASLRCSCNKFIKWLTPGEVAKLEARLGGQR